ncbi:Ubiquitin--protein ligase [Bertholletia excelsa]
MELNEINANSPTHISFGAVEDDMFKWQGIIMGPMETPFEGGVFHISLRFPPDYPFKPPHVKFQTKVYHPNVDKDGTIDINILKDQWSPALTAEKLLLSICSILMDPVLDDIEENPISDLYRNDRISYNRTAREWTKRYAIC